MNLEQMNPEQIKDALWNFYSPLHVLIIKENTIEKKDLEPFRKKIGLATEEIKNPFFDYYNSPTLSNMYALSAYLDKDTPVYKAKLKQLLNNQVDYSCENCKYFKFGENDYIFETNCEDGPSYRCSAASVSITRDHMKNKSVNCNCFAPKDF